MAVASGSRRGGYEYDFVGDVKDFECPLCLHVTREPHLTSCCGQHFCGSCIKRIISDRKPCPFCKERRFTVLLDKKQKRKVLELTIKCRESKRGCNWTGQPGNVNAHLSDECDYVDVDCPNNCGTKLRRRRLEEHRTQVCPKRRFTCEHCGHKNKYEWIVSKHITRCPKYPLPCPNYCTAASFERALLDEHIKDCPLQQVECEYQSFGCTTTILRKDLTKHMEENIQQHMLMMTKELKSTKEKLGKAEEKLRKTEEKLANAEEKLGKAEETTGILTAKVAELENCTMVVPLTFYLHEFRQLWNGNKIVTQKTFFTHPNGYRLRLTCFVGSNILFFALQKINTKNDDDLQWPLKCTVNLSVVDQGDNRIHTRRNCMVSLTKDSASRDAFSMNDITTKTMLEKLRFGLRDVIAAVSNDKLLFKLDIVDINK